LWVSWGGSQGDALPGFTFDVKNERRKLKISLPPFRNSINYAGFISSCRKSGAFLRTPNFVSKTAGYQELL
jgi:hypothetical protein